LLFVSIRAAQYSTGAEETKKKQKMNNPKMKWPRTRRLSTRIESAPKTD